MPLSLHRPWLDNTMLCNHPSVLGSGSGSYPSNGRVFFGDGTVAAPSITFASDTDVGFFRPASNEMAGAAAGIEVFSFTNAAGVGQVKFSATGTATAPAITFNGDQDTGIYRPGGNSIGIASNGATNLFIDNNGITLGANATGCAFMPRVAGAVGGPAFSFVGDVDTGMYRVGADDLGFSTGGAISFRVAGTASIVCAGSATPAGGQANMRLLFGSAGAAGIYFGSGAPTVVAPQGSIYLRTDGSSTSTRLYVATDAAGTWTNLTAAT
jgi:hypothetical protein